MKRKSVLMTVMSLVLALSLLTAPALADKGKEPQGKGKEESGHSAAYEAGFAFGQALAKGTAVCIVIVAVGGIVIGVVSRSRSRRSGEGRSIREVPVHGGYYRPAAKGESCGHMPENWSGEVPPAEAPLAANPPEFVWPAAPAEEKPPIPMAEPAPVHPSLGDNPFAAFEELFDGDPAEEIPEEPEEEEPGDVNFKI